MFPTFLRSEFITVCAVTIFVIILKVINQQLVALVYVHLYHNNKYQPQWTVQCIKYSYAELFTVYVG